MTLRTCLVSLILTWPSLLFAGSSDEIFRIVCHAAADGNDSINANERLTITRRPTYGAAIGFVFDNYQVKFTVDFEKRPEDDHWAVTFIDTTINETFSEVSSKIGTDMDEFSMKVKTPDQSKLLSLNCNIFRF